MWPFQSLQTHGYREVLCCVLGHCVALHTPSNSFKFLFNCQTLFSGVLPFLPSDTQIQISFDNFSNTNNWDIYYLPDGGNPILINGGDSFWLTNNDNLNFQNLYFQVYINSGTFSNKIGGYFTKSTKSLVNRIVAKCSTIYINLKI